MIDAADRLMFQRGYEAVGVAELCRVADTKKGSFYFFFDSKQALTLEMLDRAWHRTRSTIIAGSLTDRTKGAVEAFEAYGNLLADNLDRMQQFEDGDGVVVGCRFGNFGVELSTRDEVIRERVAAVFDEMVEAAAAAITRGVEAGEIERPADLEATATQMISQMEGLMVLAKVRRDPDLLRQLGSAAAQLLR